MALLAATLAALVCRAEAEATCASCAADHSVHLLQGTLSWATPTVGLQQTASASRVADEDSGHFWPHPRGRLGSLSQTHYGVPAERLKNLSASLAWKWVHPTNTSAFLFGTNIDKDKNIIISSLQGVFKYSPDGALLWAREDLRFAESPVLMGDALFGLRRARAVMYALDLETGRTRWSRKVALTTGLQGDMVEGRSGVLVAAVDAASPDTQTGVPSLRAIGVNASDSEELWSYTPDCGLWNIMALFPDKDSAVLMDSCGGLYRLNLYTGAEIWRRPGHLESWTDGGSMLDADGNVYTCSNGESDFLSSSYPGRLRKYRMEDGLLLWETKLQNPCMNFPAVSPDGKTVVVSDGGNTIWPPMKQMRGRPLEEIEEAWALQQALLQNKSQMRHYGQKDLDASLMGFDAGTGAMKWKHDVEPWYGMGFAGDEERAYLYAKGEHALGVCGPPHWGGISIDQNGKVYAGRGDGKLYIFDPASKTETTFYTGDGSLMGGVAFAPGLMVVPTCSWVHVFKF